ncbi:hypothetical protein ElyMa_001969000 [Elysia marginata]|uniref:Uncharacterized protein n=1 Tax=Elysia marginata TaxID=1093978 RepID=A0AAV4F1U6_9GAST|nr:hypothetical protein ElyMa_001969000 [Elysia marginata]
MCLDFVLSTAIDHGLDMRKSNSASDKEKLQNARNAQQTVTIYLASPGAKDYELGPVVVVVVVAVVVVVVVEREEEEEEVGIFVGIIVVFISKDVKLQNE